MSSEPYQSPLPIPDLTSFVDMKLRDMLSSLNCHQVGTIESFDPATQTASISLNVKLSVAGILRSYPLLVKVPVFVLGGGTRVVTVPIQQGDTCLVLFNDRDLDNWATTGAVTIPSSQRLHDLSDGLALVGFRSAANPVPDYHATDVQVRNGDSVVGVGELLLVKNATTDLKTVLTAFITAMTALNSKTGPDASAPIAIANTQLQSLLKSS